MLGLGALAAATPAHALCRQALAIGLIRREFFVHPRQGRVHDIAQPGLVDLQTSVLNHAAVNTIWCGKVWKFKAPDAFPDFRDVPHTFRRIDQLSSANVR